MDWISLILMFLPLILKLIEALINRNPKRILRGRDRKQAQSSLRYHYAQLQKAKPYMTPAQHAKYDDKIESIEANYDLAMSPAPDA